MLTNDISPFVGFFSWLKGLGKRPASLPPPPPPPSHLPGNTVLFVTVDYTYIHELSTDESPNTLPSETTSKVHDIASGQLLYNTAIYMYSVNNSSVI